MIDYVAALAVRSLNLLFGLVPISASLWLGRRIGAAVFFFNKKRRLIAYANLKAALGREKTPSELRAITKRAYENMAQTFVEILNLTKVSKAYVDRYVKIVNFERIVNASKSSRGTILLTAHFGNWELSNLTSPITGFPITVLVREQKMRRLNELLNRLRESKGCKVIRKGVSTKWILRALLNKEIVGILADQDAGKKGVFVDFFGRPASTASGPMEIAKRTGAIILPNFIVRVKGPYHRVFLEEYIDFKSSPETDDSIRRNVERYIRLLENYVRRYPDQWLWMHKRWKSTPIKTVLVLNDGRSGHLNQSLAVARQIQTARTTQGYKMEDTRIVVRDVRYSSGLKRAALTISGAFSSWRCHGCMACMRYCLERESCEGLMKTYCDFVVSCGSGLAPVNAFMARENNAKNIVVMSPGIVGLGKFNLAVIPRHDRPRPAKNVVATELAPNLIDEGTLKLKAETFAAALGLKRERRRIGLLVGGDTPEFTLSVELMNRVADGIISAAETLEAELLVTTSRRTPKAVETLMKDRLKGNPRCKLLVIANEDNPEGAVAGILGLSDVVVVSGESISMVSEAVSSSRPVIVFGLDRRKARASKHEAAMRRLEAAGRLIISDPAGMKDEILRSTDNPRQAARCGDNERIYEAVRRLI